MKRNYIGTTAYGSQVIVYELDEAVDVLRILLMQFQTTISQTIQDTL